MKTGTFGPSDWTDVHAPDVSTYTKSKTLAGKGGMEFYQRTRRRCTNGTEPSSPPGGCSAHPWGATSLVNPCPCWTKCCAANCLWCQEQPFQMVDVRDVAKLHVQALKLPKADNKRIIAASSEPKRFPKCCAIPERPGLQRSQHADRP